MGKLAGFKYWQIIKQLKKLGFEFNRQAAVNRPGYPGEVLAQKLGGFVCVV